MWLWKRESEFEIQAASGMLRVTVKPKTNSSLFIVEAGLIAAFIYFNWSRLPAMFHANPVYWTLFGLALATSLWFLLTGSEEIEFDAHRQLLTVRRGFLGWPGPREYSFVDIYGLAAREPENNNPDGLTCRWKGRTVTFGKGVSPKQADFILSELQRALPDSAPELMAGGDPFGKHFITLNL